MLIRGGKVLLGSLWFDPWGPSAGGTDRGRSPAGVQSPSPPVLLWPGLRLRLASLVFASMM